MARREITQFFDDLDQSPLTEEEVKVIRFSLDGNNYILDLSASNAAKFHEAIAPFVKVARLAPPPEKCGANPGDIRAWARTQGIKVAHRGKIPLEVISAYNEAHT